MEVLLLLIAVHYGSQKKCNCDCEGHGSASDETAAAPDWDCSFRQNPGMWLSAITTYAIAFGVAIWGWHVLLTTGSSHMSTMGAIGLLAAATCPLWIEMAVQLLLMVLTIALVLLSNRVLKRAEAQAS